MKKALLIGGLIATASLLGGCMIISCDAQGGVKRPCILGGPSGGVATVVLLPGRGGSDTNRPRPTAGHRPSAALASCLADEPGYNNLQRDDRNLRNRVQMKDVAQL
ncbi:MAG: hypothetical protein MUC88_04050 [Planctomycetes bacterium]|jgi:hypothetical protein|nr:hypothetical protein [Planctomycetota bacterium]